MHLLLDQGVSRDAAFGLRNLKVRCTHVGEIGMSTATDNEILARARATGAIVVTLDADFHTILAVSGASGPSVIRLRMQGLGAREIVQLMENVLDRFKSELKKGALISVKAHKISCHHLPIGGSDPGGGTD